MVHEYGITVNRGHIVELDQASRTSEKTLQQKGLLMTEI
jgi:hypothetical protein